MPILKNLQQCLKIYLMVNGLMKMLSSANKMATIIFNVEQLKTVSVDDMQFLKDAQLDWDDSLLEFNKNVLGMKV